METMWKIGTHSKARQLFPNLKRASALALAKDDDVISVVEEFLDKIPAASLAEVSIVGRKLSWKIKNCNTSQLECSVLGSEPMIQPKYLFNSSNKDVNM